MPDFSTITGAQYPTLYFSPLSSASHRVRIALALKGVEFKSVKCDLAANEHLDPIYLSLNPQGLVPVLITPRGAVLTQSQAIFHWLDEHYPQRPLMPKDLLMRCNVIALCNLVACDIHPLQSLRLAKWLEAQGADDALFNDIAKRAIREGLVAAESLLAGHEGPYCFGREITAADIWLVPQMRNAHRFNVDLGSLKRLPDIEHACMNHEEFACE